IEYSLIARTPERDLLPMARALDLAVTPWGILGSGVLTGKYNQKTPVEEGRAKEGRGKDAEVLKIAAEVVAVATEIGCTPTQVAVAWLRHQPGVMVPILGARTREQLTDNLECLTVELGSGHLARLDQISKIDLGFPHDFLEQEYIRNLTHGGTYDLIDDHRRR
ncbi:aldo/keto reductase, partial [Gemmatimonadota bacterium]